MNTAVNPLQWMATDDGWLDPGMAPPLAERLDRLREYGFSALQIDLPPGLGVPAYAQLLASRALGPAAGYLSLDVDHPDGADNWLSRADELARTSKELGLDAVVVAARMSPQAPRVLRPAVGAEADPGRLERVVDMVRQVAAQTLEHGVTSCLHQHVGTWLETGSEIETVLEQIGPDTLGVCPDTGHLAWAQIDPVAFVARHADRVRVLHVKDARLDVARRMSDATYQEVVQAGLWVEPGDGDIDLQGVLAALGADYDGWVVVEVDRHATATPDESLRRSAEWLRANAA